MKRFLLSLAVVFLLSINGTVNAVPVTFYLYNWEGAMKDTDGTLLKEDCRVELIWAGADGIIDYLQADPSGANFMEPGGDDILLGAYGVGQGIPETYVPAENYEGHIEAWVGNLELNPYTAYGDDLSPYDDNFYVRFYNAVDPVSAFYSLGSVGWGESNVFNISEPDVNGFSPDVNFTYNEDFYVTYMIPEPFTMITLCLSLIGIKFFNRRR